MATQTAQSTHTETDFTSLTAPSSGASLRRAEERAPNSASTPASVGNEFSNLLLDALTYATMPAISGGFYLWDTFLNGGAALNQLGTSFSVDM